MHYLINKEFKILYCSVCKTFYVECPNCGMNTCSGGYGENENGKCPVCPIAYELDATIRKHDLEHTIKNL